MRYHIIPLLLIIFSCSNPSECPEFIFDKLDNTTYSSDKKLYTGRCSTFFEGENTIKSVQQYLNGKDYGKWKYYFENGQIETKGQFNKYGKRIGKWKYYFENGQIKQLSRYSKDGDRTGEWYEYDSDGNIIKFINY